MLPAFNRLSWRQLARRQIVRTIAGQDPTPTPTAAEIKKTVPELWVRKMKTFFTFYDVNGDGVLTNEDYRMFEGMVVANARANSVNEEDIKRFKSRLETLWIGNFAGGQERFQWTENNFIEVMYESVNRTGSEAQFRNVSHELFDLTDLNQDGTITKEEYRAMRGGDPWSIVAFSAMDTNKDGDITREEFEQAYMDFFFNFADDTNPSKHLMGPLVKL